MIELLSEGDVYSRIGEEGFQRLVAAFYGQVPADDILGPMYPKEDMHGAEERLRDFLIGRFGGPRRYEERRGHPRLRMRHMPFKLDQAARDRWVRLMDRAIDEAQLPEDAAKVLRDFFHHMATFLMNAPTAHGR
jgi:hemoglobin